MSASIVRVIALGSPHGGDDEAALRAAAALAAGSGGAFEVTIAGRPGVGLVDLLAGDAPVLLLDVVRSGARPGAVVDVSLTSLVDRSLPLDPVSSHGFGPAEALRLACALGRPTPRGRFVGVEGQRFEVGAPLSPEVEASLPEMIAAARQAISALSRGEA
ncbi:MAG: hydrogenase maturation protease [Nannocystaceae bacterium]